jgi:hypothetical protein
LERVLVIVCASNASSSNVAFTILPSSPPVYALPMHRLFFPVEPIQELHEIASNTKQSEALHTKLTHVVKLHL